MHQRLCAKPLLFKTKPQHTARFKALQHKQPNEPGRHTFFLFFFFSFFFFGANIPGDLPMIQEHCIKQVSTIQSPPSSLTSPYKCTVRLFPVPRSHIMALVQIYESIFCMIFKKNWKVLSFLWGCYPRPYILPAKSSATLLLIPNTLIDTSHSY